MAFKYTGDASLGVGLSIETPKPLDNRTVVANLSELYSIPEKYAYQGMTVANIDNGNIYMLLDKSRISEKEGWKASYESIQIIQCTQEEYNEWKSNTTDDFKPIDESKEYLHSESYYYIYEDSLSEDQFYLSASWGKNIEEQLKNRALNSTVVSIRNDVNTILSSYVTSENLISNYVPKTDLNLEDPESFLSTTLSVYAYKQTVDELKDLLISDYVTKESLRGGSESGEDDDFIFVTQKKYQEDQTSNYQHFTTLLLTANGIETQSITIQKRVEEQLNSQATLETTNNRLSVNGKEVANLDEVPKIVYLHQDEYDSLSESSQVQDDTYYCTYDDGHQATGYVRGDYLEQEYYTKNQVDLLIKQAVKQLEKQIAEIGGITVSDNTLIIGEYDDSNQ